ncbi:aldo/keto reductase [Bombilactobacillus bombi]|uniref:Aldo/keto reductase n=1 Tax=Bombilactobacillus bombi TaxID=1303590 RepID=A0A3R6VBN3_9LACO|nr:aldo/keto reductase [Bombilactobacillus bombi]RHW52345.1 aldo/keto reductase [Bombilactobacillus bombi]
MKTVTINHQVLPAIGIGTWHLGDQPQQQAKEIAAIRLRIEMGAQVIDTAEMYGNGRSEHLVAQAIKPYSRQKLFLISKVLPQNASHKRMAHSLKASLQRLQTDYLDLYLYHWRGHVPLAETISELQHFQDQGLIRAWGVSNFDLSDMQELWQLPHGPNVAANEDLYNLGSRGIEYSLLPWQQQHHLPMIAYSPVSNGDQLGAHLTQHPTVLQIAQQHQVSPYQIMLAWTISHPNILAIPKASQPQHMKDNLAALNLNLSTAELAALDQAYPAPQHKEPLDIL